MRFVLTLSSRLSSNRYSDNFSRKPVSSHSLSIRTPLFCSRHDSLSLCVNSPSTIPPAPLWRLAFVLSIACCVLSFGRIAKVVAPSLVPGRVWYQGDTASGRYPQRVEASKKTGRNRFSEREAVTSMRRSRTSAITSEEDRERGSCRRSSKMLPGSGQFGEE